MDHDVVVGIVVVIAAATAAVAIVATTEASTAEILCYHRSSMSIIQS